MRHDCVSECPQGEAAWREPVNLTADDRAQPAPEPHSASDRSPRYSERPPDWRTRLFGLGGTASLAATILAGALFTWHFVQPLAIPPQQPLMVVLAPPAAPPEPVREMPEGPEPVRQEEKRAEEKQQPDPPLQILPPRPEATPVEVRPQSEPAQATEPVPETTAPRTLPAPPANRTANSAEATWEARILTHLEKHRRYPARARLARQQGVVFVTFSMSRAGQVLSASIRRGSGYAALDQAALDTLRRAQPLPAIPDDRPDTVELTLAVDFFVN